MSYRARAIFRVTKVTKHGVMMVFPGWSNTRTMYYLKKTLPSWLVEAAVPEYRGYCEINLAAEKISHLRPRRWEEP